jgi:hypothetical protein
MTISKAPLAIQPRRKRHDAARTAQADMIASIRPEIVPARIQRIDRPTITHHHAIAVAREHAVSGRVDEQQPILLVDSKPARVGDSGIVGEQRGFPSSSHVGRATSRFAPAALVTIRGIAGVPSLGRTWDSGKSHCQHNV